MIDRSTCPARTHGTPNAYMNQRCRCPDAKEAQRIYRKRRTLARARGHRGPVGLVPIWRAARRFQALARMGYSGSEVQAEAWGYGRNFGNAWRYQQSLGPERFARLDAVYQRWSAVPGTNTQARRVAEKRNFPAPLDWDDIDDPTEVPYNHRLVKGVRGKAAA